MSRSAFPLCRASSTGSFEPHDQVLTRPFLTVLLLAFLGFSIEQILRPVVSLITLARGGDVVLVGVMAAIPAVASVVFRPVTGRFVDGWRHAHLLRAGTFLATLAPLGLLAPGTLVLAPARFLHGIAWALFSVSNHALLARLAPASRRGEASGYFMAMPALATLVAPGIGIGLYVAGGELGPVLLASGLGLLATVVAFRVRIPVRNQPSHATQIQVPIEGLRAGSILEHTALPATFMVTTFMAAHALFTIFPPVYAISVGAPIESLALYYPTYGLIMLLSQLFAGKASDRLGRGTTIRIGCGIGMVGLVVVTLGAGIPALFVGGGFYAVGVALVAPTMSAMTIDRAPQGRVGSAMATYSVGYTLATGGSSLIWGAVIAAIGFDRAFLFAMGLLLVTFTASLRYAR